MLVRASLTSLLAVLSGSVLSSGCDDSDGAGDGGGQIELSDAGPYVPPPDGATDGGPDSVDAGPINSATFIEGITPPSGALTGGYRRRIDGGGFTAGCTLEPPAGSFCRIFFGDVEASRPLPIQLPNAISVEVPPGVAPGLVKVRIETEIGVGELEGGFTYFSPLSLDDVVPAHGSTDGGTPVTLTGLGLTDTMIVTIGSRQVVNLVVAADGTSATFLAPPGTVGRADLMAIDSFGRSVLELAFTYDSPVRLDSVEPNVVDDDGSVIELLGSGFSDEGTDVSVVTVGGLPAARNNLIADARLRVVVPAGLSGSQDVVVTRGAASATLADALVVRPPLAGGFVVSAAIPVRADIAGGTAVTLVGEGLTSTTAVFVAGVAATNVTVVDDRTVTFTAPAGTAGAAVIELTRADASNQQLAAFAYFAPVIVSSANPFFGSVDGGGSVTLTGRGFSADPFVSATFGGVPATDVVVVSDTQITATVPAGPAGFVDVAVIVGAERGVRAGTYRYDAPLSIIGVRPSRGALGGETFVTVTGTGFSRGPGTVTFGDTPALPVDVHVINDSTMTLRTPPHQPELVDIIVTQGAETVTGDRLYNYFDPTSIVGGTRGGSIDGAVYVTVLDATLGLPISGAVAYVGTSAQPTAAGITNVLGQATISGPEVVGPQTVTVAKDCFSSHTLVDVDATEITVFMMSLGCGPPPTPGPPPPGRAPPTIRGRVFGFAKEFFDPGVLDQTGCTGTAPLKCEIAFAEVTTTTRDEFSGAVPAGGGNVVFEEGGEYFIAQSRPGRLAVVAIAGIYDVNNQTFRVRQMGVRREVFPQFDVNLTDQDVELTIPLDEEVELALPDAPMRFDAAQAGFKPTITLVRPFMQFGGEGAFTYTQAVEGKRNHLLKEMPDVPGEMITFIAGAYTTDGRNMFTQDGTVTLVEGQPYVTGVGTSDWGIVTDGQPAAVGQIFVTDRPDGTRFASVIYGAPDPNTLQLQNAPDFSATNRAYHIGVPGFPMSEVVQDGSGDLRGGVTIQPVLGLPEVISPLENGVIVDRTLRWKAAPGQQPSIHDMYLYDPFNFASVWEFYVDGSRTKVLLPDVPAFNDIVDALPTAERTCLIDPEVSELCGFYGALDEFVEPSDLLRGGIAWQHSTIYTPGLEFANWSLLEIQGRGPRSTTTDVHVFVNGN